VVRQTKYEWLYVIGAVCPETGESVGLLSPTINSDVVSLFLKQFTEEVSHDVHILLLWDQAGFHTSKKLNIPKNMTIVPLPGKKRRKEGQEKRPNGGHLDY
jgi:transposase